MIIYSQREGETPEGKEETAMKNQKVTVTATNLFTMMDETIDTVTDALGGIVLKGAYKVVKVEPRKD